MCLAVFAPPLRATASEREGGPIPKPSSRGRRHSGRGGSDTTVATATVSYTDALFATAFMVLGFVFWTVLGLWFLFWRKAPRRDRTAAALCIALAIGFAIQAGYFGVVARDRYLIETQEHYSYTLFLRGNWTARGGVVVPIPTDEILLTNLHVDSGDANWSLVDTVHGRGLYVSFLGFANLSADFSEFSPSGRIRDDTPTMGNQTYGCVRSAYVFLEGPRAVGVSLYIGDCSLQMAAYPGWTGGEFYCCPPVPVV